MGLFAKLFLLLCAIIYTIAVLHLLVKQKINEKNTIYWLTGVFFVLILASIPDLLDKAAILIGISYPPSLLFLFTSLVLLYIVLRQAVQLSVLDAKVRELAQLVALQKQQDIQETKKNGEVD
jgi:hypothetical protein